MAHLLACRSIQPESGQNPQTQTSGQQIAQSSIGQSKSKPKREIPEEALSRAAVHTQLFAHTAQLSRQAQLLRHILHKIAQASPVESNSIRSAHESTRAGHLPSQSAADFADQAASNRIQRFELTDHSVQILRHIQLYHTE